MRDKNRSSDASPGRSGEHSERKIARLEAELRHHKQLSSTLTAMLEAAPDGVVMASLEGELEFANKGALDLAGVANINQLKNRSVFDFLDDDGRQLRDEVRPILQKGGSWRGRMNVVRLDGAIIPCEVSCAYQMDDQNAPRSLVITFGDVSEQEKAAKEREALEDQLRQSQKMEAIGTLAGGVAHDMNNVLGAITSLAYLLKEELSERSRHRQEVEGILDAAKRGADLTRNLLGFARKGTYRKEEVDINEVVHGVQKLLAHTSPKAVEMRSMLDDAIPPIMGDFGQLSHAIMNVCINAIDAMDENGVLTISSRRVILGKDDLVGWKDLDPGVFVRLDIIDTGKGMEASVLEHVFEPFFTTKDVNEGTGLGLSMVYGTVRSHDGAVKIDSRPGTGTRVTVYFPLLDEHTRQKEKRVSSSVAPPHVEKEAVILLVDDEVMIRRSSKRLIEKMGFGVILASNGMEAIEIVEHSGDIITLVVLDLIMPTMDGEKTFYAIKSKAPDLPVIISSGFSKDGKVNRLLSDGAAGFVQKPFTFKSFKKELAKALAIEEARE